MICLKQYKRSICRDTVLNSTRMYLWIHIFLAFSIFLEVIKPSYINICYFPKTNVSRAKNKYKFVLEEVVTSLKCMANLAQAVFTFFSLFCLNKEIVSTKYPRNWGVKIQISFFHLGIQTRLNQCVKGYKTLLHCCVYL